MKVPIVCRSTHIRVYMCAQVQVDRQVGRQVGSSRPTYMSECVYTAYATKNTANMSLQVTRENCHYAAEQLTKRNTTLLTRHRTEQRVASTIYRLCSVPMPCAVRCTPYTNNLIQLLRCIVDTPAPNCEPLHANTAHEEYRQYTCSETYLLIHHRCTQSIISHHVSRYQVATQLATQLPGKGTCISTTFAGKRRYTYLTTYIDITSQKYTYLIAL